MDYCLFFILHTVTCIFFYFILCIIGDVILADRGFTCQYHIGMYMAEIKMPPFTKGKKQLEKVDVD